MLGCNRLSGDESCWAEFVARYGRNGLALKMTGETIREVFEGDIAAFLEFTLETQSTVYGGIRRLIATQVRERLSRVEQELLRWLAMEREPVPFAKLVSAVGPRVDRAAVIEALEALRRRSLVERCERGAGFRLQAVVLEYAGQHLLEPVAA